MRTAGYNSNNFLECNGQVINGIKYPKLAKIMNHTPNYQGLFLRSRGGNAAAIGQVQNDAIRNITGYTKFEADNYQNSNGALYPDYSYTVGFMRAVGADIYGEEGDLLFSFKKSYDNMIEGLHFDASRVVPTAEENRPINTAVVYLIVAR
ncbi:hypothetical protein [Pectinatus frisingensis]|uniref:hypothetical protein n=1 Tax=Pectinatus frisingensis TaxID=865 RepID=UPI003D8074EC